MTLYSAKIADLGKIVTGKTPSTKNKENFGGNIPFITPVDMSYNRNVFFTERYVSSKGAESVKGCILPPKTVCVSCIGSDMGKSVITTRTSVTNQQINSVIVNEEHNYMYVYYLMRTLENTIKSLGKNGTAVPILSKSKFSDIDIQVHDLESQCRIAKILSAYDDLIENNQKQIKLLEETAQRLYKEWFVDLRFPGYENTSVVDGVPEGWEKGTIQDIVVYHDKKRKPLSGMQRAEMQGKYRYYGAAGILDYVNNYLFDGTYLLLGEDGTVITEDGYPILQYVTGKFWVNNHAHVLTGKQDYPTEYLYMMFKATKVRDVVTGVAQPKISQARLSNKKTIIPNKEIVCNYCSIVSPMFEQILTLEHQTELLKEARDRLLPKLMSGELEV